MKIEKLSNSQIKSKKYLMNFINRVPVTLVKGRGVWVWDEDGKKYLDFVGGFATNSLGHCHPVVIKAIEEQAETLIQVSNQFYSLPQIKLAETFIKNSCFDKVFFSNSGAEANEGAVKLARRYGSLQLNGAWEVITTFSSFHGRTLAMVAATGQIKFQKPYIPLPAGFINVEYNNIQAIKQATTKNTCAVLVELIQGEGGVNVPSDSYIKEVREWCNKKGLLLILDEIQTGMGRLGTLFGYQSYGIEPDVITLAKGVTSGTPIGVILAKEKASVFVPGDHGTTFGGNPLSCAIGYAVLKYMIKNNIPHNAQTMGYFLKTGLEQLKNKHKFISDIRGKGLLIAMEFDKDIAEGVLHQLLLKGLLVNQLKTNTLRFIPPLIIKKEEIEKGLKLIDYALSNLNI
jgi:acetylornithine/N-succinyldiaminopimelate aminotransferase